MSLANFISGLLADSFLSAKVINKIGCRTGVQWALGDNYIIYGNQSRSGSTDRRIKPPRREDKIRKEKHGETNFPCFSFFIGIVIKRSMLG